MYERDESSDRFNVWLLEEAYADLVLPEFSLGGLHGKAVYYFPTDDELTQQGGIGASPIDIISAYDSDAIIVIGNNRKDGPIQGQCSMILVLSGNKDTGIHAPFSFGFSKKLTLNARFPKGLNPKFNAHKMHRKILDFGTSAESLFQERPDNAHSLSRYRLVSRLTPYSIPEVTPIRRPLKH